MSERLFRNLISQMGQFSVFYDLQMQGFKSLEQFHEVRGVRLHHFGDPLLDPLLLGGVQFLESHTCFPVHFSTSPLQLNYELARGLLRASLDRIVLALGATDNLTCKALRRPHADYDLAEHNAEVFLKLKGDLPTPTLVHIQLMMLGISRHQADRFKEIWCDKPVRVIIKDVLSYSDVPTELAPAMSKAPLTFARRICKRPFHSMTVLYDGRVVPCSLDSNAENVVGNPNE